MIFYFNSKGEPLSMIHERVFQGSNRASTIYYISPTSKENYVNVSFTLPDGSSVPKHIMEVNEQVLNGVFDEDGNVFNAWKYDIPSCITAIPGAVTAQFHVFTSESEVATTASVQFYVERGVSVVEPDHGDSYQELLNALISVKNKSDYTAEDFYAFLERNELADKVDKSSISNIIYGTDAVGEQTQYEVGDYLNRINVNKDDKTPRLTVYPNLEYYFGEVDSISLTLADGEKEGQLFYLTFKSGETAPNFSISGKYKAIKEPTSASNVLTEISGLWNGETWLIAWRHL